jgi:hypothetical protein
MRNEGDERVTPLLDERASDTVESRSDLNGSANGRRSRRIIRFHAPERREEDLAKPLVAAIAHELWKLHGGNDVLNWLEAEILLQNALAADRSFDAAGIHPE